MSRTRYGRPRRSSCSRGCTRTDGSAATKSGDSERKRSEGSPGSGTTKRAKASGRTLDGSITSGLGDEFDAETRRRRDRHREVSLCLLCVFLCVSASLRRKLSSMKYIHYSKYTEEDLGIGAEELLQALSDFLLESGFNTQYSPFSQWSERTLEDLKQAIQQALEQGRLFDDDRLQEMMERLQAMTPEQMDKLPENRVKKMADEGQITIEEPGEPQAPSGGMGNGRDSKVKFEVTDKSLDFLGFKTLKDLLGSLGKSSFGRHDTRDLATGIETSGASKPYEFGDMLNLDVSETLFSAIRREGAKVPLDMDYSDLRVHQCEYQSSCATVLMLDCSHSMILYGEDRFTPAKKVAMALAHLIKTQYPGDILRCVLFHDSAEELQISQLARVQVGPYY